MANVYWVVKKGDQYYYRPQAIAARKITFKLLQGSTYWCFGAIRLYDTSGNVFTWSKIAGSGYNGTFELTSPSGKVVSTGTLAHSGVTYPYESYKAIANQDTLSTYPAYALSTGLSTLTLTFDSTVHIGKIGYCVGPRDGNGYVSQLEILVDDVSFGTYNMESPSNNIRYIVDVLTKTLEVKNV